jgi:integrase
LLRDFKHLLQDAVLPEIRFHDLRHTAASLMLNDGTPPIVVSRRLGHSKASITLDVYGHLIPDMDAKAAEGIDRLLVPGVFPQEILESPVLDLQPSERVS